MGHERDVWVDAEAATAFSRGVMIATGQVDRPALLVGDAGCVDRALRSPLHWVKEAHSQDPGGDEEDGQLDTLHDLPRVIQCEEVPR